MGAARQYLPLALEVAGVELALLALFWLGGGSSSERGGSPPGFSSTCPLHILCWPRCTLAVSPGSILT
jgi:hypothetical protein